MRTSVTDTNNVVLLDDITLYDLIVSQLRIKAGSDLWFSESSEQATLCDAVAGVGFGRGLCFNIIDKNLVFLCLSEHNSQPFTYLTLGAFATLNKISSVIALTGAHSLCEDLLPGDLAFVRRASALPYPALFENRDPYAAPAAAEHYDAAPEVLEKFTTLAASPPGLWQREIPQVTCGYAKHPTWRGELMPWAPEQFQKLRDQGADTLSSTAAGVYEAQSLMPDAEIICLNQVRSNPNSDSREQWQRYKIRYHTQAVSLLLSLITAKPAALR